MASGFFRPGLEGRVSQQAGANSPLQLTSSITGSAARVSARRRNSTSLLASAGANSFGASGTAASTWGRIQLALAARHAIGGAAGAGPQSGGGGSATPATAAGRESVEGRRQPVMENWHADDVAEVCVARTNHAVRNRGIFSLSFLACGTQP